MISKGFKTSELYVVLIVVVPWVLAQFGIDMGSVDTDAQSINDTIEMIHTNSDLPVWLAMAYVVGRKVLKWFEVKKDADKPA